MTEIAPVDPTTQIEALVRSGRKLKGEIAEMNGEVKKIEDKLRVLIPAGSKVVVDSVPVLHKRGNRRFSAKMALAKMTAEQKLDVVRTTVDEKAVRAFADAQGWTEDCYEEPAADAKTTVQLS